MVNDLVTTASFVRGRNHSEGRSECKDTRCLNTPVISVFGPMLLVILRKEREEKK